MENQKPGYWGKRFLALIIDFVFITLLLWVLSALLYPLIALTNTYFLLNYWILLAGVIILAYFTYLEGKYGVTIGKNIMKLKVLASEEDMNLRNAFLRNISKFLWLPLLVDLAIGFIVGNRQRYLDQLANTRVIYIPDLKTNKTRKITK